MIALPDGYYADYPLPRLNEPLIAEILERIEREPEHWNQGSWGMRPGPDANPATACGTAYCFAGHVAARAAEERPGEVQLRWSPWIMNLENLTSVIVNDFLSGELRLVSIRDFARHELGLTYEEATRLFMGVGTDLSQVQRFFAQARVSRGLPPAPPAPAPAPLTQGELDLAGGPQ